MKKHTFFDEKNKDIDKELSEENYVAVRVWLPKIDRKPTTAFKVVPKIVLGHKNANVGHVSVEVVQEKEKLYASIWPHPKEPVTNIFKVGAPNFHLLEDDEASEGSKCDVFVRLFSLEREDIKNAFEDVKNTSVGYVLTGDSSLSNGKGESCCSLAWNLLKRGGLGEPYILPVNEGSVMKVIVEPKQLCDVVRKAKENELTLYKETVNFKLLEGEYYPYKKPERSYK